MIKCRITVLRRGFNADFVEKYVETERKKTLGPCTVFHDGQVFEIDPIVGMPAGFCTWAWDDIYKSLMGFAADGNWGQWYERKDLIIACCTDGTRPVYFKIEKIKE